MTRPLRIELAGGLYHVTSRGDRREAIYRDDEDRETWLRLIGEVCQRFNWRGHGDECLEQTYADRRDAMARAFLTGAYTMREVAEHFGVHYSTVSRAVRGLAEAMHLDKPA